MSALLVLAILVSDPVPTPAAEVTSKKIKELQKDRIVLLKDAADLSLKLGKAARMDMYEALEERMALLKAELEVAEKPSERPALYLKALEDMKEYEELAKALFANKGSTQLPVLKIKAKRLETEIVLEQSKIREAKDYRTELVSQIDKYLS